MALNFFLILPTLTTRWQLPDPHNDPAIIA